MIGILVLRSHVRLNVCFNRQSMCNWQAASRLSSLHIAEIILQPWEKNTQHYNSLNVAQRFVVPHVVDGEAHFALFLPKAMPASRHPRGQSLYHAQHSGEVLLQKRRQAAIIQSFRKICSKLPRHAAPLHHQMLGYFSPHAEELN